MGQKNMKVLMKTDINDVNILDDESFILLFLSSCPYHNATLAYLQLNLEIWHIQYVTFIPIGLPFGF